MASILEDNFCLPWLHQWNEEFTTRRNLDLEEENKPCVMFSREWNPEDDIITLFMDKEDSDPCPCQAAEKLNEFCTRAKTIEAFDAANLKEPVAWVDQSDWNGRRRLGRRALTSYELYQVLKRPRFRSRKAIEVSHHTILEKSQCESQNTNPLVTNTEEPDAERCLVYIVNLDQWSILALAATASYHQAYVLRCLIYEHLSFNALFDISITSEGLSTFALIFHLPFYASRKSRFAREDRRKISNQRTLRHHQDITFLRSPPWTGRKNNTDRDFLYESQISCAVTGADVCLWVAYLFIDLYYEANDGESLKDYEMQVEDLEKDLGEHIGTSMIPDPLTAGKLTYKPIRKPREYFLKVFEIRSRKVKKEWHKVVTTVLENTRNSRNHYVENWENKHRKSLSSLDTEEEREMRNEFRLWTNKTIGLLRDLVKTMNETLDAWKTFTSGGVRYFHAPGGLRNIAEPDTNSLLEVTKNFREMSLLSNKMERLRKELCEDTNFLGLQFAHENNESALAQQRTARDVNVLTWITFHSIPFALVAALLSTRDGFLPVPETPSSLVVSIIIVETIVWVLLDKLSGWIWFRKIAKWTQWRIRIRQKEASDIEHV